jgi:chromate transporter
MLMGALGGLLLCRGAVRSFEVPHSAPVSRNAGVVALVLFAGLLVGLPIATALVQNRTLALFDAFYRSGALVFGGGHVVLPLLREAVVTPGWIDDSVFLAGYGATQAVPGPLFTFAAYLGAMVDPAAPLPGAAIALVAIFLPGLLLVLGTLPFWGLLRNRTRAQAAMHGVNAAVVGLLGAALYDPVWTSAVRTHGDFALALIGFVLLVAWRMPPLAVVIIGAAGGIFLGV